MPDIKKTINFTLFHSLATLLQKLIVKPSLCFRNKIKIIENKFGSIKYIILYLYCQTNKNEKK